MTLVNRFSEGCGLFEFDIATPLFDQLAADFELLTPDPLPPSLLDAVDSRPGLYGLHHQGSLVYVGKADVSARESQRVSMIRWDYFAWCAKKPPIGFASKEIEAANQMKNNRFMKKPIEIFPLQNLCLCRRR